MAHYVDNKKLFAVLVEHRNKRLEAEKNEEPAPRVPEYVGVCLHQIANRLSRKPNFSNYTFREEMVSDGLENCINYLNNFNPEKSSNPFAYFTQIIYFAFLRRIQKEKKQMYVRHKFVENSMLLNTIVSQSLHTDEAITPAYVDLTNEYMTDFVKNFEEKEAEKKEQRKVKAIKDSGVLVNEDSANN
jgi:DNA-directed RNA polymerase specialized sigma24 family protein